MDGRTIAIDHPRELAHGSPWGLIWKGKLVDVHLTWMWLFVGHFT